VFETSRHLLVSPITSSHQGQAQILDDLNFMKLYGSNPRQFRSIASFCDKRRQDWLANELPDKPNTKDVSYATHHILQHQLLDLLVDSIGYRSNPSRPNLPKVALERVIPDNLSTVSYAWPLIADRTAEYHSFEVPE
jgi:hypothetical protein